MTRDRVETMARRASPWVFAASAIGNICVSVFFAAGFDFITPQRTIAQLQHADSVQRVEIADIGRIVDSLHHLDEISRSEQQREIHAVLKIGCLTAPRPIRDQVNLDCQAVLSEGAIR